MARRVNMTYALAEVTIQFANAHLQPYRIKSNGTEIIPLLCPFCKGGDHGDQETFALNLDSGLYVCKRGSCGAKGRLRQLMHMFGESSAGGRVGAGRQSKAYT